MQIRQATLDDLESVAPLFDAYRQFYLQPPDLPLARAFLYARLSAGESLVYLAEDAETALGFVQLYPLFSSTAPRPGRIWLLNDLYVAPAARGRGVGRRLMDRARQLAKETSAAAIELATARTNATAQALYESLGYRRDEQFLHYSLEL
ncbi:MAG TPA: GNAT family N-acetyltransferase [Gemmatimonadales bacterium]|jgi:ribosomal protein S18 acetylase RimI-like enzyme|nr:GNAT family N-acetyltransferase [Gemmatimonadales bacterium]